MSKTYHATRTLEIILDGESLEIEAAIEFTVEPYSPGWFDPRYGGEPPSGGHVDEARCKSIAIPARKAKIAPADHPTPGAVLEPARPRVALDCPAWLSDWIKEKLDQAALYDEAMEREEYDRESAAEMRAEEAREDRDASPVLDWEG